MQVFDRNSAMGDITDEPIDNLNALLKRLDGMKVSQITLHDQRGHASLCPPEAGGAGTKQDSRQKNTSAVRANFGCSADSHPPVFSRRGGCDLQIPVGSCLLGHSDHHTMLARMPLDSSHKTSRIN